MMNPILLQAPENSGNIQSLILFGGIALVFYFFMIRPQAKKQKKQKQYLNQIEKGDNVITIGGVHGKVISTDDETVVLEVDKGVKLTLSKSAINAEASASLDKK